MTDTLDTDTLDTDTRLVPSCEVRTRAEAAAYVASVCFKHGPPKLLGVELEWTVHHADDPRRPLDVEVLSDALGPHAPPSLVPDSPHRQLPGGSVLTVEPGGQVEISSLPTSSMCTLFDTVTADAHYVDTLLAKSELRLGQQGTDSWRAPRRVLRVPRYIAMESAFDRIGVHGRLMMCSTAGIQVCIDVGERHRVAPRWAALHALGPIMMATFANSPWLCGARTGWASARTRSLLRTDPPRTCPDPVGGDPSTRWAKRILETTLVCLRRDGDDWRAPSGVSFGEWIDGALPWWPTRDDLDYHMSTMFTPVRPRGYFEVRYLDAQVGQEWMLPVAALIALFRDESTVDELLDMAAPADGRWVAAARRGLADPGLARTARSVFDLACRRLSASECPPGLPGWLDDVVQRRLAAAADS